MKKLLLLLLTCALFTFTSCKKLDDLSAITGSTTTPAYTVKSGTVSVTTPDTTYIFTAPADQIYLSATQSYFNIVCYRDNLTSFNITSTDAIGINTALNIYEIHLYGPYKNVSQIYANTTATNIGTLNLTTLSISNTSTSGSFKANLTKAANGSQANAPTAAITGTFDLKFGN